MLASLAPSGRYMAEDFHRAGGAVAVIGELIRSGLIDGAAPTVTGRSLAEEARRAAEPDGEVVFPVAQPFKATGALHALRGNLAPDGSLVKASGTVRRGHQRAGAGVRQRRGVHRRSAGRPRRSQATCSSCATRARPAGRACARC